jgi:inositol phosphorylceramide mannosyltransferase catalytic subunit
MCSAAALDRRIPKIIHQTWKTRDVPAAWAESVESWQRHHPDWEYRFWTDEDLARFVHDRHPWFLETWLDYPYAIQRVDSARYLILHTFGGVYSDLDIFARRSCEFLQCHGAVIPETLPLGFSNDLMMASSDHPLFAHLMRRLIPAHRRYSRAWGLPRHFRVMLSAGSLFLTGGYRTFSQKDSVYILPPPLYREEGEEALVRHVTGNSWHEWDSRLLGRVFAGWTGLTRAFSTKPAGGRRPK